MSPLHFLSPSYLELWPSVIRNFSSYTSHPPKPCYCLFLLMLCPLLESSPPLSPPSSLPVQHCTDSAQASITWASRMRSQVSHPRQLQGFVPVTFHWNDLCMFPSPPGPQSLQGQEACLMTNICISVIYPRIWHRVGTWQVFCWTELSGDLGRRHSRDRTCDLGFISISVKQWSQPPKDWQKLAILGIRVNCSWDQHSPMWVTQIGLVVKKASVLHSMS